MLHVPFLLVNPPEGYDSEEIEYFSHLDLATLVPALARGETPDVFRERVPAEIVGMSPGPDPDSDRDYWDRAMRCVYEGEQKWVWDSLGTSERYAIDHDRPCWQECVEDDATVPEWAYDYFEVGISEYKSRASESDDDIDVDAATEERLEDLGYM